MLMPAKNETMATSIEGPFMIWMKTGFIVGLVISAPWVFYQIWAFIAAGLYPHERRYVHLYLPISLLLFCGWCVVRILRCVQLCSGFPFSIQCYDGY